MRVLVTGAVGAVGRVVVERLRARGHDVVRAGRSASNDVRLDLADPTSSAALADAAREVDIVVNASGIEDVGLVRAVAPTALVEVSATGRYLQRLRETAPAGVTVVLGAGLIPGLSTVLVDELTTRQGDDVDLFVMLGSGEDHGAAARAWTLGLAAADLTDPPEGVAVRNFLEARRVPAGTRAPVGHPYRRADFPDHLLADPARGIAVRSYLAMSSRAETKALGLLARAPGLAPLARLVPQFGGSEWRLLATVRRTGESIAAHGIGQSRATGTLVADAAERAVVTAPGRAVGMHELARGANAWWPVSRRPGTVTAP